MDEMLMNEKIEHLFTQKNSKAKQITTFTVKFLSFRFSSM